MDGTLKSAMPTNSRRSGLLKHQLRLVKRKDCASYEILPIAEPLSFEKGLFIFIRACQLLAQKMEGVILVGLAGPSGAGKTVFTEKLVGFMPGIATISMDNYNDSTRVIDGNYDDPRLTDYDLLLENIHDLKAGKAIQVPVYDFKLSSRVGHRNLEVPSSRIVVIEGIYALSEKLRPFLDLRVAVRGGVHFDLIKRVLRDINRAGQDPEEIIHQISETVYPMYKAFIEPDLETAHIKIVNKFNPFSGFQNPTYILKSARTVIEDQIRQVLSPNCVEANEETYDIYLLPPGEDPETCQSYLRMRNRDGKYSLLFEEMVTDNPFIISPRISFEVSVRLLGGLMALGYTITTILNRISKVFSDDKICIKIDKLEQLQRKYLQIQGKDRRLVAEAGKNLGLEGSYIPHSYIEQIQLEKLTSEVMALSEGLKTKLSISENLASPRSLNSVMVANKGDSKSIYSKSFSWTHDEARNISLSVPTLQDVSEHEERKFVKPQLSWIERNGRRYDDRPLDSPVSVDGEQGHTRLLEQLSALNERLEDVLSRLGELENKLSTVSKGRTLSQQNLSTQVGPSLTTGTSSYGNGYANGSTIALGVPNAPSTAETLLLEEVKILGRGQHHLTTQLDVLSGFLRDNLNEPKQQRKQELSIWSTVFNMETILGFSLLSVGFIIGAVGVKALKKA